MKPLFQLLPFLFLCSFLSAQEICDNGVDDDGDGLIDLNDTEDCECFTNVPSSLIPNPSFEDMSCCPMGEGEFECVDFWNQASGPTTDYVHTCGSLGNAFIGKFAPLPFPDGNGGIGFRDGKPGQPNFKEYAGACLTSRMELDKKYRLDFFTGFPDDPFSTVFDMSLYATTECSNLPFGGNPDDGCPTNFAEWDLIGRQTVNGLNEWKNVIFEFTATKEYEAIVLGPSCDPHPNYTEDPYFFFDRLLLAEREQFGLPFDSVEGSVCAEGVTITVDFPDALSFQWYLNGVALLGQDQSEITLQEGNLPEGQYQCVITNIDGCFVSQVYQMEIPLYEVFDEEYVCAGDSLLLNNQIITEADVYDFMLIASDGCDSMVQVDVEVRQHSSFGYQDTICEGEVYAIDGFEFEVEGIFDYMIPNAEGCDSTITFELEVIPKTGGVQVDEELIELELGETIQISPSFVDPALGNLMWLDGEGNVVSSTGEILNFQPITDADLYLIAADEYGCPASDTLAIRVLKDIRVYIPNIFTPEDPNINNKFKVYSTPAVEQIAEIFIYDRWGNLVFEESDTGSLESYIGWNGRFQGDYAMNGVYVYIVTLDIIDGTQEVYTGDITLVR